jgi:hypothetical protein
MTIHLLPVPLSISIKQALPNQISIPHRKHWVSTTKIIGLNLLLEIIAVYCGYHMKDVKTQWAKCMVF